MWRVKLIRYVWDTLCKQVTPWAADARHGRLTPVRRYDFTSVGKADPGVPAPSIRTLATQSISRRRLGLEHYIRAARLHREWNFQ